MSTLGGSRGERNAKPKFSALDINRMYKNSRGETTEPSAQKNQVPRKHGMQSLGKVPSARRPPANLPSLKAETTSSPSIANNNIVTGQEGGIQNQTSGSNQLKNSTSSGSSSNSSGHITTNNNSNSNSNTTLSSNQNNNSNSSSTVIGVGSKLINNSSSIGKGGGGGSNQSHHHHHHSQQKPITWSAVTTGNDNQRGGKPTATVPPLYQSPQFQHEFPTLDGTVGGGGSGGSVNANRRSGGGDRDYHQQQSQHHQQQHHHSNSNHQNYHHYQRGGEYHHGSNVSGGAGGRHHHQQRNDAHNYKDGNEGDGVRSHGDVSRDMNEVSLRPHTNAAAWLEQQEKNAKGVAADSQSNHQGQGLQHSSSNNSGAAVPLPILTLMPSFMQRGVPIPPNGGTSTSICGRAQTPPNYQNGIGKDSSSSSSLNIRTQARGSGNAHEYRSNSSNSSAGTSTFRQSTALPKRPPLLNTPPPSNGGGNGHRKDKEYIIEPEVAPMQRPIIREEDLERLNAIANDDSWTKQEEIDYTKKLTFSDDETPEDTPMQEREIPVFNKNSNVNDQRKNSNASGTSSTTGTGSWQRKDRDSSERDKSSSGGDHIDDTRHQNGHRSGVGSGCIQMDAVIYERVKLRKEEEERREMERKQAAARKKQELEMKMNSKKSSSDIYDQQHGGQSTSSTTGSVGDESNQQQGRRNGGNYERSNNADRGNGRSNFDSRDMRVGGGDYARGSGNNSGMLTSAAVTNTGMNSSASSSNTQSGSKAVFSAQFQSNLPPRFQRQQQMTGAVGAGSGGTNTSVAAGRSTSVAGAAASGLEKSSSTSNYENSRYIQKGQGSQRGGPRGEYRDNYSRGYRSRNDSDRDDERYHSRSGMGGRDDYGRGSAISAPNQLSRSISDTSQRKTSVSSNDNDSLKHGYGGESTSFGGGLVSSWAEETEVELKRQRDESFSSSHSHDSLPIKILQRPHTQKSLSEEENVQPHQSKQQRMSESSDHQSSSLFAPTQILRRSESSEQSKLTNLVPSQLENQTGKLLEANQEEKNNANETATADGNKQSCAMNQVQSSAIISGNEVSDSNKSHEHDGRVGAGPQLQREKRPSPRSGGSGSVGGGRDRDRDRDRDVRISHSRSFGASGSSYRGGRDAGWNQRSGNRRYQNSDDHYQDHEDDDVDDGGYSSGRRSERSPKVPRKEGGGRGDRGGRGGGVDERGFAPRGEPSRRGRGGGGNIGERGITSSTYRRSNDGRSSVSGQRQYGRQGYQEDHKDVRRTSESSETNNSELDKTKQNQMALSAGLSKVKENDGDRSSPSDSQSVSNTSKQTASSQQQPQTSKEAEGLPSSSTSQPNEQQKQTRKDSNLNTKSDDELRCSNSIVDRERKSSSKEKDLSGLGSCVTTSVTSSSSTRSTTSSGGTFTPIGIGNQPNKQDLPMTTSLPTTVAQQSCVTATNKFTTQPSTLQQQNPTSSSNKPSPGMGGMKPAGSSASIASIGSNPPPKASPETQLSKTEVQTVAISSSVKQDNDKNKFGSMGSLSVENKSNGGSLLVDGAPVSTIIFENTNYKQQVQAAQMKCSSESLVVSSSVVSGVNVSVTGVDTLTNALSQMTFGGSSGKQGDVSVPQAGPQNDYDKEMKLGFSFGDATESYTTATKGMVAPSSSAGDNDVKQGSVIAQQQQQQTQPSLQQQAQVNLQQQQTPQHQQQQQQNSQQAQNIISAADLNMKIASVKKVWESVQPMASESTNTVQQLQQQQLHHQQQQQMEAVDTGGHMTAASFVAAVAASQQQQQQQHMPHYAVAAVHMQQHHALSSPGSGVPSAFGAHGSPFDAAQLEPQFGQNAAGIVVGANDDGSVVGYPSPQQQQSVQQQQQQSLKHSSDAVKQQQQVSASAKQMQHHSSSMGMSPPPNLQQQQQHQQQQQQQQQQQSAAQQQMHAPQPFYQASPQFTGIPTIPSPPAVVFNSSQMPPPSQGGLYAPFHSLDHSSRSQFSAAAHSFPGHYGAATAAGGPFNAYPMQTPPNMATAPTPDMYSNLTSQFRMGGGPSPFGNPNSQQINNPNAAVAIISSNSNSLMSTVGSVKPPPTSQQLGTIGSKAAGGGGPFAAAQQYMNLYAPGPPQHPQGGPPGPPPGHQLQSNSYYSNSAGGPNGPGAFYGGPPPQGAGANAQSYGLAAAAAAASLYGQHAGHQGGPPGSNGPPGPPQGPPGPQSQHTMSNFNTQFMNSQLLTAAAINQFRGGPTPQQQAAAAAYIKSSQQQTHLQDSMVRQLKSPLGSDVSLTIAKHGQSQPSPPHHKNYGSWDQVMQQQAAAQQQQQQSQQAVQQRIAGGGSGSNNQNMNPNNRAGGAGGPPPGSQSSQQGRYPTPIQRPTNYPQHPQGPQSQQQVQQQQQQQAQRGQQPQNLRQGGNSNGGNGPQGGPGGPQGGANVGGAPGNGGGPGGPIGNNQGGGGNGNQQPAGQPQQMNKPYYANNAASAGPNRANHN